MGGAVAASAAELLIGDALYADMFAHQRFCLLRIMCFKCIKNLLMLLHRAVQPVYRRQLCLPEWPQPALHMACLVSQKAVAAGLVDDVVKRLVLVVILPLVASGERTLAAQCSLPQ